MSTTDTDVATDPIEALRARNPAAVRLATLVSTAMRVEPTLLRLCRMLLADADVGAEADLWASDLLAGTSPLALTLRPPVARALRRELADMPADLRDEALASVNRSHAGEHWSVRLEERLNQLEVTGDMDSADERRDLLLAAVGELRSAATSTSGDPQMRVDIARWLLSALARLPDDLQSTEAAYAAGVAGSLHLDGRVDRARADESGNRERWRTWLIESASIGPPREVGVRFLPGVLEINTPPDRDVVMIRLPRTEPCVVDVHVPGPTGTVVTRLSIEGTTAVSMRVAVDELVLSAVDGSRWTVRRGGVAPPSGFDFSRIRESLRPCLAQQFLVDNALRTIGNAWWTAISGPAGTGKSTLLNRVLDELAAPGFGAIVATHFFGVESAWDDPSALVASIESQLRSALAVAGLGDLATDPSEGHPGRRMEAVLRAVAATGARLVVIALDNLPGNSPDEVKAALFERVSMPSRPPPSVHFLVSTRFPGGVRDWLEDGDPIQFVDVSETADVCRAMVEATGNTHLREVIGLVNANPRALRRVLDWVEQQSDRPIALADLPAPLVGRDLVSWGLLDELLPRIWGVVAAVAEPGCTIGDVLTAVDPTESPLRVVEAFSAVPDLFWVGEADHPRDRELRVVDASVRESAIARTGADEVRRAHESFVAYWEDDLVAATRYQLLNATTHSRAAGHPFTFAANVAFLARIVRVAGSAVAREVLASAEHADLQLVAVLDRALAETGVLADAEPALAESLLISEFVRLGRDPAELGDPRWPMVLQLERIVALTESRPAWTVALPRPLIAVQGATLVLASPSTVQRLDPADGRVMSETAISQNTVALTADDDAAVIVTGVGAFTVDEPSLRGAPYGALAGAVAAALVPSGLVVGYADGRVRVHAPAITTVELTGHSGPITAIAGFGELIVTAAADCTVRVWRTDGRTAGIHRGHTAPVRHLAVVDGDVVSGDDAGGLRVWSPETGRQRAVIGGHEAAVTGLVALPGGVVSTALDGSVRWSGVGVGGSPERVLRAHGLGVVAATRGPKEMGPDVAVTVDSDGTVTWWTPASGAIGTVRPSGIVTPVTDIVCVGRMAVVAHAGGATAVAPTTTSGDGSMDTKALTVSADGRFVATLVEHQLETLDLQTGAIIDARRLERDETTIGLTTADGNLIILGEDGRIEIGRRPEFVGSDLPDAPASSTASSTSVASSWGPSEPNSNDLPDNDSDRWLDPVGEDFDSAGSPITAVAADRTGGSVLFATADGSVRSTSRDVAAVLLAGPGAAVAAMAADGRGGALVARVDGTIEFANPERHAVHHFDSVFTFVARHPAPVEPGTDPQVRRAARSEAPREVFPPDAIGATPDGVLWRIDDDGRRTLLGRHGAAITGLCYAAPFIGAEHLRRPIVVSAGADGTLRAWDTISGSCVGAIAAPEPFVSLAASNDRVLARTARDELWIVHCAPPVDNDLPYVQSFATTTPSPLGTATHEIDVQIVDLSDDLDLVDVAIVDLNDEYTVRSVRLVENSANLLVPLLEPIRIGELGLTVSLALDGPSVAPSFQIALHVSAPTLGGARVVSVSVGTGMAPDEPNVRAVA